MPRSADGRSCWYSDFMRSFIRRWLLKVKPMSWKEWKPDLIIEDADNIDNQSLQLQVAIAGKKCIEIRPVDIYGYYITRRAASLD